nr:glycosyltransferase family 2 protein [Micromonospora sp. DSM 115978]
MRNDEVANDWVLFLDADEWVPDDLAGEIEERVGNEDCAAFAMRWRLVFAGRWIAHCGWYENSWQARLLDRRKASYANGEVYGERPTVNGRVVRLRHDFVDEDAKGLAHWLHKHVRYAELEASRRHAANSSNRIGDVVRSARGSTRPLARTVAKDVVYPRVPVKPVLLFIYMYLLRSGWRDGRAGLLFCFNHAWYEVTVGALSEAHSGRHSERGDPGRRHVPSSGVSVTIPRQP